MWVTEGKIAHDFGPLAEKYIYEIYLFRLHPRPNDNKSKTYYVSPNRYEIFQVNDDSCEFFSQTKIDNNIHSVLNPST